jgi:hypothetical protein
VTESARLRSSFLERQLENPVRLARLKRWGGAILVLLVVAEVASLFFLYRDQGHFWFEDLPAWGTLYGLISCVAIIAGSKVVGKLWLMRRETYYDS